VSKKRSPQLPKPDKGSRTTPDDVSRRERSQQLASEGARLLAARRPGEALPLLAEAFDLDPQNAAAAINLGGAYILQGRHAQAVPVLEVASRLEPDNAMVWSNLAAAYLGKLPLATRDQEDRAITAYEHALALNPAAPHVHYNLGLIYLGRNDLEIAASHFYSALQTDPGDVDAERYLVRIRRGELDESGPQG
jgi:Flp pilus assembly protein TadD